MGKWKYQELNVIIKEGKDQNNKILTFQELKCNYQRRKGLKQKNPNLISFPLSLTVSLTVSPSLSLSISPAPATAPDLPRRWGNLNSGRPTGGVLLLAPELLAARTQPSSLPPPAPRGDAELGDGGT